MCGRYALRTSTPKLARLLGVEPKSISDRVDSFEPSYNIAPTQSVLACRSNREFTPELVTMRWGLIPSWSKGDTGKFSMINARAETINERPAYRTAVRFRRCLIPADGFYEWQRRPEVKQPYFIGLRSAEPFAFAGIWERWKDANRQSLISCSIITTEANQALRAIHYRMPVILEEADYEKWLNPRVTNRDEIAPMLRPYADEAVISYPVSSFVNKAANNDERCWQSIAE